LGLSATARIALPRRVERQNVINRRDGNRGDGEILSLLRPDADAPNRQSRAIGRSKLRSALPIRDAPGSQPDVSATEADVVYQTCRRNGSRHQPSLADAHDAATMNAMAADGSSGSRARRLRSTRAEGADRRMRRDAKLGKRSTVVIAVKRWPAREDRAQPSHRSAQLRQCRPARGLRDFKQLERRFSHMIVAELQSEISRYRESCMAAGP